MATWTDIKTTKYAASVGSYDVGLSVTLQYDADSITPTSVTLRFKGSKSSTYYGTDMYYVLVNPGNTSGNEKMFLVKGNNVAPTTTASFKISKTYTAETFSIPTYWICHMGQVKPVYDSSDKRWYATFHNDQTGKNQTKTIYTWFADGDWWYNSRMNYKTVVSSTSKTIDDDSTVGTAVTAPTAPTVTDNGNNTFTITGYTGKAGKNNPVKSTTLYYRLGSSGDYTKASGLSVANKKITVGSTTATQTVYAYTKVDGTYNDVESSKVSLAIKNYQAPGNPGTPSLTASSKTNNRLTTRKTWGYTWSKAANTNSSSPVVGYRLRLYKGDTKITGLTFDKTNQKLKKGSGSTEYIDLALGNNLTHTSTTSSYTVYLDPKDFGYNTKDQVKLSLFAWSTNGKSEMLFSGGGSNPVFSAETTVASAGVVYTNIDGNTTGWKVGQVFIYSGSNWEEADSVQIYDGTDWKESV